MPFHVRSRIPGKHELRVIHPRLPKPFYKTFDDPGEAGRVGERAPWEGVDSEDGGSIEEVVAKHRARRPLGRVGWNSAGTDVASSGRRLGRDPIQETGCIRQPPGMRRTALTRERQPES